MLGGANHVLMLPLISDYISIESRADCCSVAQNMQAFSCTCDNFLQILTSPDGVRAAADLADMAVYTPYLTRSVCNSTDQSAHQNSEIGHDRCRRFNRLPVVSYGRAHWAMSANLDGLSAALRPDSKIPRILWIVPINISLELHLSLLLGRLIFRLDSPISLQGARRHLTLARLLECWSSCPQCCSFQSCLVLFCLLLLLCLPSGLRRIAPCKSATSCL